VGDTVHTSIQACCGMQQRSMQQQQSKAAYASIASPQRLVCGSGRVRE
jgi:hypothetical protein